MDPFSQVFAKMFLLLKSYAEIHWGRTILIEYPI